MDFGSMPNAFAVCYNSHCTRCQECLRFAAGKQQLGRMTGAAVYPQAWKDGDCCCFRKNSKVTMAWGFSHLYRHLDRKRAAEARSRVQAYFSAGAGPYYRYHHGERMLTPAQQQDILRLMSQFGPADKLRFDHYVEAYDFT